MSLRVVRLHEHDAVWPAFLLDAHGKVIEHARLTMDGPAPWPQAERTCVIVPGHGVRVTLMDLPARNPVQALATARLLLARDQPVPVTDDALHVVMVDAASPDHPEGRLTVSVARTQIDAWLQHCAAMGLPAPDVLLPDCLALPPPDADAPADAVVVVSDGDACIARGHALAFRADPALTGLLLAGRPRLPLDHATASTAMAHAATAPTVNLLDDPGQTGDHAPLPRRQRRLLVLAAVAALSPALVWTAAAVRLDLAADALHARSEAAIDAVLPDRPDSLAPMAALRERQRMQQARDGLPAAASALFRALQVSGAQLEALHYEADGMLHASVSHADQAMLDTAIDTLGEHGQAVQRTGTRREGQRHFSDLAMSAVPPPSLSGSAP